MDDGSGAVHEFYYEVVEGAAKVIWGHSLTTIPTHSRRCQLDDQGLEVWKKVSFEHTRRELDVYCTSFY